MTTRIIHEEPKKLTAKQKQIIEDAGKELSELLNAKTAPSIESIIKRKQKVKAYEEERKEFWKAVYIASINNEHCRSYKTFHYADEALEEFDKRFKN